MGIEDSVKQVLPPIVLILYFLFFRRKFKHLALPTEMIIISSAVFSSNFQFFYRILGQVLIIIYIIYSLINSKQKKISYINILLIYGFFILSSFLGNIIDMKYYSIAIINYISIAFTSYFLVKECKDEKVRYDIFGLFAFLGTILGVVSILEYFLTSIRAEVTFSNSNFASIFLLVSLILGIEYMKQMESWKLNAFSVIILLGIIGTGSRTTFVLGLTVMFLQLLSIKNIFKFSIPLAIAILLLGSSFGDGIFNRFNSLDEDGSVMERVEIYETSYEIIKTHPINGIGYGQFQVQFIKYLPNSVIGGLLQNRDEIVTHNDYIRIADELGLIALFIVVVFLIKLSYEITKSYGVKSCYFWMLMSIMIFSSTHNNLNSFITWFIIGLCYESTGKKNIKSYLSKYKCSSN